MGYRNQYRQKLCPAQGGLVQGRNNSENTLIAFRLDAKNCIVLPSPGASALFRPGKIKLFISAIEQCHIYRHKQRVMRIRDFRRQYTIY